MQQPAVKGILLLGAAVSVRRLREAGRISEDELAARLSGEALALVDAKIDVARWYPVEHFRELLELDWEIAGERREAYLRRAGELRARSLLDAGTYQQMDYMKRRERPGNRQELVRKVSLVSTLTNSLWNFIQPRVRLDPERGDTLEIVWENAEHMPDALRITTEGFMAVLSEQWGARGRVTSTRPEPGLIIFHFERA